MDKKRILIVSSSFYPMNSPRAFRTTELVKEFARQGHDVTLVTLKNDDVHVPFEREFGITIKDLGSRKFKTLNTSNGIKVSVLFKRIINRGMNLLFEYPDIELMFKVSDAIKKEKDYDLLISVAHPHPVHWGVNRAFRKNNSIAKTWVADCGDPYMGAPLDTFNKLFYFQFFEKGFCKKADFITVPIENAKEGYYPEFRDKIMVIPQGFNFNGIEIDTSLYQKNPIPTFAYAGSLIPGGRDPRELLSYLIGLDRDFKFIIYTKSTHLVEPFQNKSNGRIEIRDYIPRENLLRVLGSMDFLINFENSTTVQMPSKLIDYYLTGRPVLSIGSTDINTNLMDQFLEKNYTQQLQIEDADQYRIENVCSQFLDLCHP